MFFLHGGRRGRYRLGGSNGSRYNRGHGSRLGNGRGRDHPLLPQGADGGPLYLGYSCSGCCRLGLRAILDSGGEVFEFFRSHGAEERLGFCFDRCGLGGRLRYTARCFYGLGRLLELNLGPVCGLVQRTQHAVVDTVENRLF